MTIAADGKGEQTLKVCPLFLILFGRQIPVPVILP